MQLQLLFIVCVCACECACWGDLKFIHFMVTRQTMKATIAGAAAAAAVTILLIKR